jgi:hypothetical protein
MAEQQMKEKRIPVDQLLLDPDNPRLPEELKGASQPRILDYLYDNAVLEELARSYLNNGFFQHEHLIVTPHNGDFVALEGNRRLAALKIVLQDDDAEEAELRFALEDEVGDELPESLLEPLPVFVVDDREEVRKYLGFRHIGGIKTWSAEAKARYLADEVDLVREGENPFLDVARRVGSNVQGVRHAFIAISVLRHARDEFGLQVSRIQHRRFGVWVRAMNSPDLRTYIGLGDPRTYTEVLEDLRNLDKKTLAEVLGDLVPAKGRKKALVADSRDVTTYAQALHNEQARRALREYEDFELARQIVEEAGLADRLFSLRQSTELVMTEVSRAEKLDDGVVEAARELATVAAALRAVAESKA